MDKDMFYLVISQLVMMEIVLIVMPVYSIDSTDGQACTRSATAGVDRPWVSRHGRDIAANANRLYVMNADAYSVQCCGFLVEWRYQASPRARVRPITFMVWRPITSTTKFRLVGQSSHWYMKDKSRSVGIRVDDSVDEDIEPLTVQKGDLIGWHSYKGDVITYSPSSHIHGSTIVMWEMNMSSVPTEWEMDLSTGKTLNRVYGLQAVSEPVPVPSFFHPPKRLSVKCPLPAKNYVTTIKTEPTVFRNVTYSVYGYNPWFTIDKISGEVTTLIPISGNVSHEMTVSATSLCGRRSFLTFIIQCIHLLEEERECIKIKKTNKIPVISAPSVVSVPENKSSGSLVFAIHVYDEDQSDNITICIVCSSAFCHLFHIDNIEGAVYIEKNETLDYEIAREHEFHATAFDGHSSSRTSSITVAVTNVNEAPYPNQDILVIDSDANKKGSVLLKDVDSLFTDPDGDELELHLNRKEALNSSYFEFAGELDAVILSKDLKVQKMDSPSTVSFEMIAFDGYLSGQMKVVLRMAYKNSRPKILNLPTNITIMEDEFDVGQIVFNAVVQDEDVGDDIKFIWSSHRDNYDEKAIFSVNRTNGDVTLLYVPPLSLGQVSLTEITVKAFDGKSFSDANALSITIVGINEAPRFLHKAFQVVINESQVGSPLFALTFDTVKDPDPGDILTLKMADGNGSASHKNLFISNGQIRIKNGYDIDMIENPSTFEVHLKVSDYGGLTDDTILEIVVQDENDNAPVVENDGETFHISDQVYPGLRIGQIKATDLDSDLNGKLSFQVIGSSLNDTSQYFAISSSSGWLVSTGQSPPAEWISLYIAVSDHGTPALITMITVNIIIKPDNDTNNNDQDIRSLDHNSNINDDTEDDVFAEQLNKYKKYPNTSGERHVGSKSHPERKAAILILIAICCLLIAVSVALGYHLWKAKKLLRVTGSHSGTHHEYSFPWIPRQINGDDDDTETNNATGNFLGTSIINQNCTYQQVSQDQESFTICNNESNPFSINFKAGEKFPNIDCQSHQRLQHNDKHFDIISLSEENDESYQHEDKNFNRVAKHFVEKDKIKTLNIQYDSFCETPIKCQVENREQNEPIRQISSTHAQEKLTPF